MPQLDMISYWRNRQAELDFHICRLEWFMSKPVVLDPQALQHKIDVYRAEWKSYQTCIQRALKKKPTRIGSTNGVFHAA
jgi:hypothetical protein